MPRLPEAEGRITATAVGLTRLQKTWLVFIALFELGSLICGLAVSSDMLIVGRAIAGKSLKLVQIVSGSLNATF
jgi:predicted MFS family arabinose efflux permease